MTRPVQAGSGGLKCSGCQWAPRLARRERFRTLPKACNDSQPPGPPPACPWRARPPTAPPRPPVSLEARRPRAERCTSGGKTSRLPLIARRRLDSRSARRPACLRCAGVVRDHWLVQTTEHTAPDETDRTDGRLLHWHSSRIHLLTPLGSRMLRPYISLRYYRPKERWARVLLLALQNFIANHR